MVPATANAHIPASSTSPSWLNFARMTTPPPLSGPIFRAFLPIWSFFLSFHDTEKLDPPLERNLLDFQRIGSRQSTTMVKKEGD